MPCCPTPRTRAGLPPSRWTRSLLRRPPPYCSRHRRPCCSKHRRKRALQAPLAGRPPSCWLMPPSRPMPSCWLTLRCHPTWCCWPSPCCLPTPCCWSMPSRWPTLCCRSPPRCWRGRRGCPLRGRRWQCGASEGSSAASHGRQQRGRGTCHPCRQRASSTKCRRSPSCGTAGAQAGLAAPRAMAQADTQGSRDTSRRARGRGRPNCRQARRLCVWSNR
mmetsp:Transcript_34632/g.99812  ORF Transcript_34632/g.99812 Transcript_34632/m.99812 type:complete len:218 (+) Transcript_34632:369-1022(+)